MKKNAVKRIHKTIWILIGALLIVWSVSSTTYAAKARKMTVTLNKKTITLMEGKKYRLKGTIKNKKKGAKLVWKSSNKKIASVSKKGVVTAKKGSTSKVTITATIKGTSKKAKCKVKVNSYIETMKVTNAETIILNLGQSTKLNTQVTPESAYTKEVTYAVTSDRIRISKDGTVTALKPGNTRITITTKGKTKSGQKLSETRMIIVFDLIPVPTPPAPTQKPSTSPTPTTSPGSEPTTSPTVEPSTSPTAQPTDDPNSDYDYYGVWKEDKIPDNVLLAGTRVFNYEGDTCTAYIVNKSYNGSITVDFKGKKMTKSGGVAEMVEMLQNEYAGKYFDTQKIYYIRRYGETWGKVFLDIETEVDSENNYTYHYKGKKLTYSELNVEMPDVYIQANKSDVYFNKYSSKYGFIVTFGDTTSEVTVE
ncbi:MAG: Ig-like domain-containing protein [Lachnospiraceae bacterium]|nr:Ig-like domain-containing protein [Lachnospiraceae bacterium]